MARPGPAGASPQVIQRAPGRSGRATGQLIGRAREFSLLADLWRDAAAGRPGLALIGGGAGVGKTRLAAELAETARLHGAVVTSSQCFGTSGRLALAPVADWLRSPAVQSATATLDPAWRAEVGRLVPKEGRGERAAGLRTMADAWQRHRFFEGLARALIAAGRPTLLILDNMQWCDQETLAFLTFFLGLAADSPVLLAGTLRNDNGDQDPELADWIVRMRHRAAAEAEPAGSLGDTAHPVRPSPTLVRGPRGPPRPRRRSRCTRRRAVRGNIVIDGAPLVVSAKMNNCLEHPTPPPEVATSAAVVEPLDLLSPSSAISRR